MNVLCRTYVCDSSTLSNLAYMHARANEKMTKRRSLRQKMPSKRRQRSSVKRCFRKDGGWGEIRRHAHRSIFELARDFWRHLFFVGSLLSHQSVAHICETTRAYTCDTTHSLIKNKPSLHARGCSFIDAFVRSLLNHQRVDESHTYVRRPMHTRATQLIH